MQSFKSHLINESALSALRTATKAHNMKLFSKFITEITKNQRKKKEAYALTYVRQGKMGILRIRPLPGSKWVEVRGKVGFEYNYDENDYLHRTMTLIGKGVNVSDFVNGTEVVLYDRGDKVAKLALRAVRAIVKYPDAQHW